ncbi:MAG: fumarate hydratase [Kiritimatiellae bacterium]|jgi:L(+)-tartrate dehydratase alpha subunit|nr:fumarate hydratase [Kiritimatiellia bacterium]
MITKPHLEEAMYRAMALAATNMPPDVRAALERVLEEETEPLARQHLQVSLDNADLAAKGEGLVCADTGFPMFFVKAGAQTRIEDGFGAVNECAARATARATADCLLRPTMVDPFTRANPGDNVGNGMPKVELVFEGDGDGLEVIAAPKGGGSEIFGTFYRMLFPADGVAGVKKFVVECIRDACYAGKICPPAIIGVGVGGTADLCMALAKKAALLRRVGFHHSDPALAVLEDELTNAARSLGIGPMGARGVNAVLAVHIATAATHTAALPVAFNAQCLVGRRWKAILDGSGHATFTGEI